MSKKSTELIDRREGDLAAFIRDELAAMNVDQLRDQLAQQLEMSAEHLLRLALTIHELETRGEDLSDLKLGLMPYLRRIADGQIIPEIVVRYAGFPSMIQRISGYSLADQRRIASGESIELAVINDKGESSKRMIDPLHLTSHQMRVVFARDHVRNLPEQMAILESHRAFPESVKPKAPRGTVRADRDRGGLVSGKKFLPHADVLLALAALRDADYEDDPTGETRPLVVQIPEADHRSIKIAAAKSGQSVASLVRRAIAAAGLTADEGSED